MRSRHTARLLSSLFVVSLFLVTGPVHSAANGAESQAVVPRSAWNVGLGLGFGSSWLTARDDVSEGGSLTFDLDVSLGHGLTEQTLLSAGIVQRAAWFPDATSSEIMLNSYTLTLTHFPLRDAGLFLSVGGGYTATDAFNLVGPPRQARVHVDGIDGYVLRGAMGYEWRIGSTFALALQFQSERHQFDDTVDGIWTHVAGVKLRWYLQPDNARR